MISKPVINPIVEEVVVVQPVIQPVIKLPVIVTTQPAVQSVTKPPVEAPVIVISKPVVQSIIEPVVESSIDVLELEPISLIEPEIVAPVVVIVPVQSVVEPVKPTVEEVVVVQPVVEVVEVVIEPPPVIEIVEVKKPVVVVAPVVEPIVETVFIPAGKLSRPITATSSRGEKVDDLVQELGDMPAAGSEPVAAPVSEVVAMPEIVLLPTFSVSEDDVVEPVVITAPVSVASKPVKVARKPDRYNAKAVKPPRRKLERHHFVNTNDIPGSIDESRLVSSMEQGKMVILNGKLKRAGRTWRRPSEYRLVGAGRRSVSCYVICENVDLDDLLGSTVTVSGKSYWVQGVRDMVVWVTDIRKSSSAPVLFR